MAQLAVSHREPTPGEIPGALAGKYMTFKLAEEEYGLEILRVREIIGTMQITRVPRSPPFVRGIISLRGKVIPVVDLRQKFGMAAAEVTEQTVIIVVQCEVAGRLVTAWLEEAIWEEEVDTCSTA
jgi:purine-binding chemotaxis protein CheW